MSEVAARIRRILEEIAGADASGPRLDDHTVLPGRILDSVGLMELLSALEQEFGLVLDDDEVVLENFRTVAALERLVDRRIGQAATAVPVPGAADAG